MTHFPNIRRSDYLTVYRPSFQRHLRHLINNGFYARELDADDFAFIEQVRERGAANASLASTDVALDEELQYWIMPYGIDHTVERRVGHYKRITHDVPPTPNEWHLRREQRERDKAIAAAELERERKAWEAAQAERKRRQLLSDQEWEAVEQLTSKQPKPRHLGAVKSRHYIPKWKFDLDRKDELRRKKAEWYEAKIRQGWEVAAALAAQQARAAERAAEPSRPATNSEIDAAIERTRVRDARLYAPAAAARAAITPEQRAVLKGTIMAILKTGGDWTPEQLQLAIIPTPAIENVKAILIELILSGGVRVDRR